MCLQRLGESRESGGRQERLVAEVTKKKRKQEIERNKKNWKSYRKKNEMMEEVIKSNRNFDKKNEYKDVGL